MKKRELLSHPTDPELLLVPLARNRGFAVISRARAQEVGRHNWYLWTGPQSVTQYAWTIYIENKVRICLYLHVLVGRSLGFSSELQVDHLDNDGLNCADNNLRPATLLQNHYNTPIRKDNKSGVKGVRFCDSSGRWHAQIRVNNKSIFVGSFVSLSEAEQTLIVVRKELHGAFASDGTRKAIPE